MPRRRSWARNLRRLVSLSSATLFVVVALGATSFHAAVAPPAAATGYTAAVEPAPGQTIAGFGASGAWWPSWLASFPASVKRQVAGMLFGPQGLALSQYRYNIGGGGAGVDVWYKAAPTFLVRPGVYDWSRDQAGRSFLELAAQYHVPQLIGFVNSAPPQFTTNHRSCGGRLIPGDEAAFAAYLADVVRHFEVADHITLSYVSPMNEPDSPQATCHQEGMVVPVRQRAVVLDDLASRLRAESPSTQVIGDETSLVSQLYREYPAWLGQAGPDIAAVAHHTYDYPTPAELAPLSHLPVAHWASEVCCFNGRTFGWQYDPTMDSGMWLANTIWGDLAVAHDSAFDWWVALSPNMGCPPTTPGCATTMNYRGRNDGLVYFDRFHGTDGNTRLYTTKRYWTLANFSRYVRPGAVLHDVAGLPPDVHAAAFQQRSNWVVVAIDNGVRGNIDLSFTLPGGAQAHSVRALVTDARHNLAPARAGMDGDRVRVVLSPQSVTTVLVGPHRPGR